MKSRNLNFLLVLLMIGMLIPANIFSQQVIEIQVSPNILNLQSNGVVVTIHTDIPFSDVNASSVTLNGVEIQSWKADSQGFFVAKFNMVEVKDLVNLGELELGVNTLILVGETGGGGDFSGSEDILIINNVPQGKK